MGRDDTESARVLYHTYMKLVFVMICLLAPGLAAAEWLDRVEDGIMGTRIHVELWADDPASRALGMEGTLSPVMSSWLPVLLFGSLGIAMFESMRT